MVDLHSGGSSVGCVLQNLFRHPVQYFVRRWNWKSAVLSSLVRSTLFFAANLGAGLPAARSAFLTELVFRATTAGFYGALTQAFRDVRPAWTGTVAGMILLPVTTHLLEFIVHYLRGTARLGESIALSVAFTALSTSFNLYAMRRGAFTVGDGSHSLWRDLGRVPTLLLDFSRVIVRGIFRFA
ncbi:MAG TPA: hypothetical protein VJM31_13640 [Vicinamibacterales bacterium]|nr:hypothetical protein [Vicinamibacterales bacterium]